MKNENIVIAERHCVKHVLITIRNQKEIAFFAKTKRFSFSLMITVRGEKRDNHEKSSS